jgi:DNA-binding response OmpR family regulator
MTTMPDPFGSNDQTILLVASDPLMRNILRETLEKAGYLVVAASDLGEALDRLKEIGPDLLMIRPYIDSMSGDEAAEYLRTKHPGLPVLMVAGFLDDDRINTRNAVEQFHVFPKPFTASELVAKVEDVLKTVRRERGTAAAPKISS